MTRGTNGGKGEGTTKMIMSEKPGDIEKERPGDEQEDTAWEFEPHKVLPMLRTATLAIDDDEAERIEKTTRHISACLLSISLGNISTLTLQPFSEYL